MLLHVARNQAFVDSHTTETSVLARRQTTIAHVKPLAIHFDRQPLVAFAGRTPVEDREIFIGMDFVTLDGYGGRFEIHQAVLVCRFVRVVSFLPNNFPIFNLPDDFFVTLRYLRADGLLADQKSFHHHSSLAPQHAH